MQLQTGSEVALAGPSNSQKMLWHGPLRRTDLAAQHVDGAGEELADDGVADDYDVDVVLLEVLLHLPPRVLVVRAPRWLKHLHTGGMQNRSDHIQAEPKRSSQGADALVS